MNMTIKFFSLLCILCLPLVAVAAESGESGNREQLQLATTDKPLLGSDQAVYVKRAEAYIRGKQFTDADVALDDLLHRFEVMMKDKGKQYFCFANDGDYRRYLEEMRNGKVENTLPIVRVDKTYARALHLKGWLASDREDWAEAIALFDRQISIAPYDIGAYIEKGYALTRKGAPQAALAVYRKAFLLADSTDQQSYSAMAMRGMGSTMIELDMLDEAASMFEQSLSLDPANQTALQELEYIGVQKLKTAALKGDLEASYQLGMLYLDGSEIVKVNYDDARKLFEAVNAKGYPGGNDGLGWMSLKGLGCRLDKAEGMRRIRLAAKQGYAPAEYHLGLINQFGLGVPKNLQQAVHWYRLSAGKGYIPAQKILAPICFEGIGKRPDREEGLQWLVLAASGGDVDAQGKLGYLYFGNEGITKNLDDAIKWTKSAAERGDPIAQYTLATCYFKGMGVPSDASRGLIWLQKSCARGHKEACKLLEELAEKSNN